MKVKIEKYLCYLRCPICKDKLRLKDKFRLICLKNHSFPIKNGVARLLTPEDLKKSQQETMRSFSYKWTRKPSEKYGFDDATNDFQRKWYLERYGWNKDAFSSFIRKKDFILDAGCGTGWAAGWFAEKNPQSVIFGIDISRSVEVAKRNLKNTDNVILLQADIDHLPFPNNFFDFISCDQVIHHTPRPQYSFEQLIKHLKKDGVLTTYIYKIKALLREMADNLIREKTTKMRPEDCYKFARSVTLLGKSLSKIKEKLDVQESIPFLNIKKGKYDVQRFIYWYFLKCFWNEKWGLDKSIITNFDWYHPKDAYRYSPNEIRQWIKKMRLKTEHFYEGDSGISIKVKKIDF